jgi:hypothetical protein
MGGIMYYRYIKVNINSTYSGKIISRGDKGVKMDGRAAISAGAQAGQSQANIYSVVFTELAGKVGFEMCLLKGEMRRPEQIEEDLSRALEWVKRGGLLHARVSDGQRGDSIPGRIESAQDAV